MNREWWFDHRSASRLVLRRFFRFPIWIRASILKVILKSLFRFSPRLPAPIGALSPLPGTAQRRRL
jgi:hypothetical protein